MQHQIVYQMKFENCAINWMKQKYKNSTNHEEITIN